MHREGECTTLPLPPQSPTAHGGARTHPSVRNTELQPVHMQRAIIPHAGNKQPILPECLKKNLRLSKTQISTTPLK